MSTPTFPPPNSSPAELLSYESEEVASQALASLTEAQKIELLYDWKGFWGRKNQLTPIGQWVIWVILAGRGFGKTRTGAETVRDWVDQGYRRIHLVAATAADARDVMVEGESGLLSVFPPHQRPIYQSSKRLITFHTGAIAVTFSADEPQRLRGPQCVAGDTPVLMADGSEKPIRNVLAGEFVATRRGPRKVLRSWMSSTSAEVSLLSILDGRSILVTGDHRICVTPVSNGTVELGTSEQGEATTKLGCSSIERSGRLRMDAFQKITTFITVTEISTIIGLKTSNCLVPPITIDCTAERNLIPISTSRRPLRELQRQGIERNESAHGDSPVVCAVPTIEAELETRLPIVRGPVLKSSGTFALRERIDRVNNAGLPIPQPDVPSAIADVYVIKEPPRFAHKVSPLGTLLAVTARRFSSAEEPTRGSVLAPAHLLSTVPFASVESYPIRLPVYDLEVEGEHEFFANGILVHNCEAFWADELAAWRFMEDAWDNLMFGFRLGDDPRGVVTTTPKPLKLLKEIIGDSNTVVTRGSSYENKSNLAPAFFQKIVKKYEGTRIGRQELLAEILEDVPGALWIRKVIDATRIKVTDIRWDLVVRIVVAIDPAVTAGEDSDETGIIVAGLTVSQHVIVIDDLTCKESPLGWAKVAIAAFKARRADRIVGEVNNGGDLVAANIYAVDPNVPFRAVRASRGKYVRAEPVAALYEQGRVHHVGFFPELEEQMCGFVPGTNEKSPDRMDALVWGVTELLIDQEEQSVTVGTGAYQDSQII